MFSSLCDEWFLLEQNHKMSKVASNQMWELAKEGFKKVFDTRQRNFIDKKIPQFRTVRENLYKQRSPEILLDVAYECKETGDVVILRDLESTPMKRFPPNEFIKLYEIARVKVRNAQKK